MQHRVLWFTNSLGGGGAESHLVRVANALDRSVFASEIAVARAGGVYEARVDRLPAMAFAPAKVTSTSAALLQSIVPLRRQLIRTAPDVLCSVMGPANLVALLATARLKRKPQLVLCAQNNPQRAFAGVHPLHVAVRHAMRHHYRHADAIVALSDGVAGGLREIDPRLTTITQVIPNAAVDKALLAGRSQPCPIQRPEGLLLVACGRLNEQKGYPVLLKAVEALNRRRSVSLWIIGEGPLLGELRQQCIRLGIESNVKFLGFQSNPYPFMSAADVFVLSSLYEGFGNVIVEAMACGVPVVSTDCPFGPREIIRSGENGLLVEPNNADALAAALFGLLSDDSLRARFVAAGQLRAERYQDTHIAAEYGKLFLRLLSGTQAAPNKATAAP